MSGERRVGGLLGGLLLLFLMVAAGAWYLYEPALRTGPSVIGAASAQPKDEFERRVRDYILNNPEIVMEAIQRLQARQRAAESSKAAAVLTARAEEVFRDPESPVGGNPKGDVTLVEFADYNCPYCRRVAPVMNEAEAADPKLRIVYKEFPILGPNSTFAAKAALAAHRQGKYPALHKALMQIRGQAEEASVLEVAAGIGIDVERLKADMNDPGIAAAIERNVELAQALGITGTPGFVIGKEIVGGAIDLKTMQALIQRARQER